MIESIQKARNIIKASDAILITVGVGMGVDSGLPDFRGNEGFWKAYPLLKNRGLKFSQMADPHWFLTNPSLAWAFYGHRLNLYRSTIPHDGFSMLHSLVKEKNDNYFIFTSNVDGQFQKSFFSEEKIVEVHGSIHHFQCSKDCTNDIWSANNENIEVDMEEFKALNMPVCPKCNAVARPNIMMFDDWHWNSERTQKQKLNYIQWIKQNENAKMAIIEIGAGIYYPYRSS